MGILDFMNISCPSRRHKLQNEMGKGPRKNGTTRKEISVSPDRG